MDLCAADSHGDVFLSPPEKKRKKKGMHLCAADSDGDICSSSNGDDALGFQKF